MIWFGLLYYRTIYNILFTIIPTTTYKTSHHERADNKIWCDW